jgi:hypothetical protein
MVSLSTGGGKSFLNLIIVWKIQIKLLFEAYLDVRIAHINIFSSAPKRPKELEPQAGMVKGSLRG